MPPRAERGQREAAALYAIAGMLLLAGPLAFELYQTHYPLRPEAVLLPLAAGALGSSVAIIARRANGVIGSVIFGALLYVFADVQLHADRWTYSLVLVIGCVVLAHILSAHRALLTVLPLTAFYVTSARRPPLASPPAMSSPPAVARSGNPVLVHVILDEAWGIGGLRAYGDTATAAFLDDFYLKRGFEVYDGAYSRYAETETSVPGFLSLGRAPDFQADQRGDPFTRRMRDVPYFTRLRELGFNIHVSEPLFVDFCRTEPVTVTSCRVASGNSIRNLGFLEGSWFTRAMWTARMFLNTRSHTYQRLVPDHRVWRRAVLGGAVEAMQALTDDISAHHDDGTAYFVHVLLPHRPVDVTASCQMLPSMSSRMLWRYDDDVDMRRSVLAYTGQLRCAHVLLDQLLHQLDSTVGRDHSIVLVHGDHGARMIGESRATAAVRTRDVGELNMLYATLLAVRRPHVPAARRVDAIPLQDALWSLADSGFAGTLGDRWEHYVLPLKEAKEPAGTIRRLSPRDMPWARATP